LLISLGATVLGSKKLTSRMYGSKGYGAKSGAIQSGNGVVSVGQGVDALNSPKRGDEGDFVPLVDYPHDKAFEKNSTYSVSISKTHGGDSI
jgi:hypothetical protein